ncbi:hypothetical protein SFMTTN_3068 [Sulfuriferula multivorans]|uniref:Uncharacterized protein n=1 Tax=Sulfuriferula multivorans TaxID=1559896 RepID=A0A401K0G2_9PROT|nr:hypothetical protein SFMTTN_3068 [Sulfuriferula multivorans]
MDAMPTSNFHTGRHKQLRCKVGCRTQAPIDRFSTSSVIF